MCQVTECVPVHGVTHTLRTEGGGRPGRPRVRGADHADRGPGVTGRPPHTWSVMAEAGGVGTHGCRSRMDADPPQGSPDTLGSPVTSPQPTHHGRPTQRREGPGDSRPAWPWDPRGCCIVGERPSTHYAAFARSSPGEDEGGAPLQRPGSPSHCGLSAHQALLGPQIIRESEMHLKRGPFQMEQKQKENLPCRAVLRK